MEDTATTADEDEVVVVAPGGAVSVAVDVGVAALNIRQPINSLLLHRHPPLLRL